jgi:hypothetical protein
VSFYACAKAKKYPNSREKLRELERENDISSKMRVCSGWGENDMFYKPRSHVRTVKLPVWMSTVD